ncbi:MAG: DUF63 family protein [Candidatus Aenigmatarchaeota archaeon]
MLEEIYASYFAGSGYTTVETVAYALLLVVAIYLIHRFFLKKIRTDIDKSFVLAMVPYLLLGGILRSLGQGDAEIFTGFWFNTPGIHLLIAAYTVPTVLLSQYLEDRYSISYVKWMWIFGGIPFLACLFSAANIGFPNYMVFVYVLGIAGALSAVLYVVTKLCPEYLTRINHHILSGHLMDGTSTFIAITVFGYTEKHVLPDILIDATGAWVMIPLKIAVVWPVLYLLDDVVEDVELLNWLKIVVLGLGLSLAARNMFTVAMAV